MLQAEQWLQCWSHGRCFRILYVEDHRLSEQQFVDCSKRSSGCNDGLMGAALAFYMLMTIASLSSSSVIAPTGAVAAMVVFPGAAGRCDRAWGLNFGCDQTVITGLGAEPWRVMPVEGGVQRALFGTCKHVGHHCVPYAPSFAVQAKYQSAVIVSGLVTFIAAYLT